MTSSRSPSSSPPSLIFKSGRSAARAAEAAMSPTGPRLACRRLRAAGAAASSAIAIPAGRGQLRLANSTVHNQGHCVPPSVQAGEGYPHGGCRSLFSARAVSSAAATRRDSLALMRWARIRPSAGAIPIQCDDNDLRHGFRTARDCKGTGDRPASREIVRRCIRNETCASAPIPAGRAGANGIDAGKPIFGAGFLQEGERIALRQVLGVDGNSGH